MKPENNKQESTWIGIDISKAELEIHSYFASPKLPQSIPNSRKEIAKLITKLNKNTRSARHF